MNSPRTNAHWTGQNGCFPLLHALFKRNQTTSLTLIEVMALTPSSPSCSIGNWKVFLSGVPNEGLKARALEWLKGLQATPVESTALGTAAVRLLAALLNGDEDAARISRLYLRGESIGTPELKKIGVYEKLDKASGFRLMRSMTQLIQIFGLASGVVLLFDEARRTLSLMTSSKRQSHVRTF